MVRPSFFVLMLVVAAGGGQGRKQQAANSTDAAQTPSALVPQAHDGSIGAVAHSAQVWSVPLRVSSVTPLPAQGFNFFGHPQCDGAGNMYFRTGMGYNSSQVVRVSPAATDALTYPLPPDFPSFYLFQVSRGGQVYLLLYSPDGPYLLTYKDDTSEPTRTKIDAPVGIEPRNFAVWSSGAVVLSGVYGDKAGELRGKPYAAEFSPAGKLRRSLVTEPYAGDSAKALLSLGADAAASFDDRGYLYFLAGDEILVLTETAGVERRIKPPAPAAHLRMAILQAAKGQLAIWFHQDNLKAGDRIKTYLEIIDPVSGDVMRMYEPEAELESRLPVCFTGESFLFLGRKEGQRVLFRADVR